MPDLPPTAPGQPARAGILVALAAGSALAAAGCSSDPEPVAAGQQTVTVTQSASSSPPALSASPSASATSASATSSTSVTVVDANADLSIDDQTGGGRQVRVDEVAISTGKAHVAIFAASGRLLGAKTIGSTVRRTTVRLSRPVPRTSELLAVLYGDNGDAEFSLADPRVVDEDGDLFDETFDYRLLR